MDYDLEHIIDHNFDLAITNGYTICNEFCLENANGFYASPSKRLHPLETMVLGQKITSPINVAIAENLGVRPSWIVGFIDGINKERQQAIFMRLIPNDPSRKHYEEGYADGEQIKEWVANMDQ